MPSQWMPRVWNTDEGQPQPSPVDADQANALTQLTVRQYNGVLRDFMEAPESSHPICEQNPPWRVSAW